MNVNKLEFLSATLDDAVGDFERHRILDELKHDQELAAKWQRYAVLGEILRAGKQPIPLFNSARQDHFLAGLHAALDDDIKTHGLGTPSADTPSVITTAVHNSVRPVPLWRTALNYGMAAGIGAAVMAGGSLWVMSNSQPTLVAQTSMESPQSTPALQTVASSTSQNLGTAIAVGGQSYQVAARPARSLSRLDPKTQAILKDYIKDHIRYASTTGVVPSVRAVSYNQ